MRIYSGALILRFFTAARNASFQPLLAVFSVNRDWCATGMLFIASRSVFAKKNAQTSHAQEVDFAKLNLVAKVGLANLDQKQEDAATQLKESVDHVAFKDHAFQLKSNLIFRHFFDWNNQIFLTFGSYEFHLGNLHLRCLRSGN